MFERSWHGIDLASLPAAAQAKDKPAGPEFYAQFYAALEAGQGQVDPGWEAAKRKLGRTLETEFLSRWTEQHGRPPRILSLGVGKGLIETAWLEKKYDVTLQECQPSSLKRLMEQYPETRVLISDACDLQIPEKFDIVAMLALDCVLDQQRLTQLLEKTRSWLQPNGYLIFISVNTLSWRQIAAEVVKHMTGRYKQDYIFWGWWRTIGEYCRLAKNAGLATKEIYVFEPSSGTRSKEVKLRPNLLKHIPHLRGGNSLYVFAPHPAPA